MHCCGRFNYSSHSTHTCVFEVQQSLISCVAHRQPPFPSGKQTGPGELSLPEERGWLCLPRLPPCPPSLPARSPCRALSPHGQTLAAALAGGPGFTLTSPATGQYWGAQRHTPGTVQTKGVGFSEWVIREDKCPEGS